MQITFKNGAQIEVDTTEINTRRNPVSDDLIALNWKTPPDFTAKLLYLRDLDDIAAIVRLEDPTPGEPA
jgi:hypothetical protein